MNFTYKLAWIILVLMFLRWAVQLWLDWLNVRHVKAHSGAVPEPFKHLMDEATYKKSVDYTLAKSRLGSVELTYDFILLLLVLLSGVLPRAFDAFAHSFGTSAWAGAAFLFLTMLILSLPGLPFDWYSQFHLEQRFGFNTTTPKLWLIDRLKGLALGVIGLITSLRRLPSHE